MPRNVSGIFYNIPGTEGFPDTTIESEKYNNYIADIAFDLNFPRPVIAGGTGATTLPEVLANIGAETASQIVSNYDSHLWTPGSFYSATSATAAPVAGHAFVGWVVSSDPPASPPTNMHVVIFAYDQTGPSRVYIREKKPTVAVPAGEWGAWGTVGTEIFISDSPPVNPPKKSLWWDSETGLLYIFYTDEDNTSQWVIACPWPDFSGFVLEGPVDGKTYGRKNKAWARSVDVAGDTMTGGLAVGGALSATGAVTAGGDVTVSKADPALTLNKLATGQTSLIQGKNNSLTRWAVAFGNSVTETTGDVGSDFSISNFTDAGVLIGDVLNFNRATGLGTVKGDPVAPLGIATKAYVDRETVNYYSLAGVKSFDVQVPAGKTTAIMNSVVVPTTAVGMRLIIQLSLSPGIFENTIGDYAREGFYHGTTSTVTAVGNIAGDAAIPGMQVHNYSDNINYPTIWDGTLFLKRLNVTNGRFIGDFRGRSYASSYGWTHSFFYNHMTASAAGSALTVVAFRITVDAGDNWGDGSYLSVIWK